MDIGGAQPRRAWRLRHANMVSSRKSNRETPGRAITHNLRAQWDPRRRRPQAGRHKHARPAWAKSWPCLASAVSATGIPGQQRRGGRILINTVGPVFSKLLSTSQQPQQSDPTKRGHAASRHQYSILRPNGEVAEVVTFGGLPPRTLNHNRHSPLAGGSPDI